MAEHTYTLTGHTAVAANIYAEVSDIFHRESAKDKANNYEEWRLEYYIISVMCAPSNIHWEVSRSNIEKYVATAYPGYGRDNQPKARYDRALRRLTKRGFLYGKTATLNAFSRNSRKERCYGLNLSRYDEKVAA